MTLLKVLTRIWAAQLILLGAAVTVTWLTGHTFDTVGITFAAGLTAGFILGKYWDQIW